MAERFDAIIIGTGRSGPSLAARMTREGMKTAIVERKLFGGTCVNVGCIPTKTLVASARAAHMARRAADFGVAIDRPIAVDMAMGDRLIAREDDDVSAEVKRILEVEDVDVRQNAECVAFVHRGDGVAMTVDCEPAREEVVGSDVLLAVGRHANTDDLGLDTAGVETDARGYIVVDDQLRTTGPGIWAIGEVNGRGAFTHTSCNEILAANMFDTIPVASPTGSRRTVSSSTRRSAGLASPSGRSGRRVARR